jgi:hypothetical protein
LTVQTPAYGLLELEVVPVVEDDVAGAVAKKVYGKK